MTVRILTGDCRIVLASLPAESVHCVVTSPPYFGLRDYGTAKWEGGEANCDHVERMARGDTERETPGGRGGSFRGGSIQFSHECAKCGARRIDSQIGLESTADEYVAEMVAVFREVRRVLRKDGTVWLNLGDSYASTTKGSGGIGSGTLNCGPVHNANSTRNQFLGSVRKLDLTDGLKSKDLIGIPWRVAFALQADGWWLRSSIIWAKPNPMPESVTDRPTSAHENVFLLAKSPTYHFDAEAVKEPETMKPQQRLTVRSDHPKGDEGRPLHMRAEGGTGGGTRNIRNVWTIATQPYAEAHFATFPPALIEPCIKAGTSERGCCPHCGGPWERIVERQGETARDVAKAKGFNGSAEAKGLPKQGLDYAGKHGTNIRPIIQIGWQPSCSCPSHDPVPATVLDPFGGAGTTGLVADRLGRNAILIELNPKYAAMAERRLQGDGGMFASVECVAS